MIHNTKNRASKKSILNNYCTENASKENKPINSQIRPLQHFVFINRSLFSKISSNGKPGLLSPTPSYWIKPTQTRQILRDNSVNKSKQKQLEFKQVKNSIEKNKMLLKIKRKNMETKIEILKTDEMFSKKNHSQSREKYNVTSNPKLKGHLNILSPNLLGNVASVPYFSNNLYSHNNLNVKKQTRQGDNNKSQERALSGQAPQSQCLQQDVSEFQNSASNFALTYQGSFMQKSRNFGNLGSLRQNSSLFKNSVKMIIENEEESVGLNTNEYARIPNYCLHYVANIVECLFEKENKQMRVVHNQEIKCPQISDSIRVNLYDSFIGISKQFRLRDRTVFLTFELIELYLNNYILKKEEFRILGISVLFLVCKYEEIYPPKLANFTKILGDEKNTRERIFEFENEILGMIKFDMTRVLVIDFFVIFSNVAQFDLQIHNFGLFVLNLCAMEQSFYACSNSLIAFGLCYFLQKLFRTIAFYEVDYEDQNMICTLNVNKGKFDINQRGFRNGSKIFEAFKINFRHKDVKSVSEGILTITQKYKENHCPNVFLKFQDQKLAYNTTGK